MDSFGDRLKIFAGSFSDRKLDSLFTEIWNEYYPKLVVYLGTSFGVDDPDDLIQEIMFKVYRQIGKYNPLYSFNTWIYSIARNQAIDGFRRNASAARADSALQQAEVIRSRCGHTTPESILLRNELEHDIADFIGNLPPTERQISFLRYYEELRYRDISRITGLPLGTVKSHLYNIRIKLARYYGENYED